MQDGRSLSTKEAALYLRSVGYPISVRTLYNMRQPGYAHKGPPHYKFGWGSVGYYKEDLATWAASQTQRVS